MPKGSFWSDTFEQLAELGKTTVKQSTQAVKQTFNPVKILEKAVKPANNQSGDKGVEKPEGGNKQNQRHTPLDLEKLQQRYQNQDKAKADMLRNRLFQLVKSGEEKVLQEKKQELLEKKRKEEWEKAEKKKRAQEAANQTPAEVPHGKERRSIFSPKKVAKREQAEVKPASGKQ
ncbi:hypothetical protein M1523_03800 [Patescibacteria group bacterium]|nr:hypothetical protein [Patescibacteria group bacterium]MCL5091817.1 hypothetical protein [Patescibacteria group bacterium]